MDILDLLAESNAMDVKVIHPNGSLLEAARKMSSHDISALIVTGRSGRIVGIISERDLVRAITEFGGEMVDKTVSDVMTRSVISCSLHDSVVEVLFLMYSNRIRHVPVLEGEDLTGIVSIRDLTRAYELLQAQANTDTLTGVSSRH